ncbi:MAG: zinc carboxypeptidase [Betaproteobacteria bacterium]|nr:zinc carboxypeptidase [Betaproteobacteria bacterium]
MCSTVGRALCCVRFSFAFARPTVPAQEFSQLTDLKRIIDAGGAHFDARVVCEIDARDCRFPVYAVTMGTQRPDAPAIGFFGGFHGLERIGAEVVLAHLSSIAMRLKWDSTLHALLESVRLVFMPLVNPGGIWRGTRANPNGVDLMRNAPIQSAEKVPYLLGGQRISPRLPWFRGVEGGVMEAENRAVCEVVDAELLSRPFSISVDCHSGFGASDRIWFPYAHTREPIAHLAEMHSLMEIFGETHSNHRYIFEPQSRQYLAHGDVWDYLYRRSLQNEARVFLPLTLEMGSWIWVKKNPRQLFSRHGIFNPLIAHRQQRVLRRHLPLLDFFARAAGSHQRWVPSADAREGHRQRALQAWYSAAGK